MWLVSAGKKHSSWWCEVCGEKNCEPKRLLVVQTGVSASQAKVFGAHAVPHRLCENLINALKLLANQQEMEIVQSRVVTDTCERSRRRIMEGLRNFIKVDNHCALEVGHLGERYKVF